jgi:signal transduction histidine kinase
MRGFPSEALESFRRYIHLKDSLFQARKSDELLRLQTEFESERKEKQIAVLEADREAKNSAIQKRNWIIFFLSIVGLMSVLLYVILRNRRKIKDELSKQQLLNRIASDLHDDVGATLSSIRMYGDIIKTKTRKDAPELNSIAEKISSNATEMINSMSDIVWTIKPGLDSFNALQDRIWNVGLELCAPKNIQFVFTERSETDDFHISTELRHDMYMISKEAINNAVKHANCTEISVGLKKENNRLELYIHDNGKGISLDAKRGNGLSNMENRSFAHAGKTTISSTKQGTQIHTFFML